ncbi:MAG: hypothetical protein J6V44_14165 [Methanobrevibacter sp.]|nr:hypothetical protein [Methanobrevibacter sp.]
MNELNDFVKNLRADFDKCRKNMESMEKGLQFVESYFTDKNFPGWTWRIYTRGTYQNKPSFEIDGNSSMHISEYATISLKYNCCNKTAPVFVIQTLKPKMNAWNLEWSDKQLYRNEMDPILKTFEGMKFKNPDPIIPQIANILIDIKKLEDVHKGILQFKSLLKQIQLKKDF